MSHTIVDVESVEPLHGVFRPLRPSLGVTAFGINHLELPPDGEALLHDHRGDGQEEVYVIVSGSGTIRVDGTEEPLAPGKLVFLPPETARQMVAGADGLAWVAVGSQPDGYRPSGK
ncbi:MAG: cupin domain-containing protein [Gaiellaceae bacterium]